MLCIRISFHTTPLTINLLNSHPIIFAYTYLNRRLILILLLILLHRWPYFFGWFEKFKGIHVESFNAFAMAMDGQSLRWQKMVWINNSNKNNNNKICNSKAKVHILSFVSMTSECGIVAGIGGIGRHQFFWQVFRRRQRIWQKYHGFKYMSDNLM